jgi:hypothetical protein
MIIQFFDLDYFFNFYEIIINLLMEFSIDNWMKNNFDGEM